jgi:hypothetical protein
MSLQCNCHIFVPPDDDWKRLKHKVKDEFLSMDIVLPTGFEISFVNNILIV